MKIFHKRRQRSHRRSNMIGSGPEEDKAFMDTYNYYASLAKSDPVIKKNMENFYSEMLRRTTIQRRNDEKLVTKNGGKIHRITKKNKTRKFLRW